MSTDPHRRSLPSFRHPDSMPSTQPSLYRRPSSFDSDAEPFAGDLFERHALAKKLADMLARISEGAVVSIDAGWGEGKTWFAKHWRAQLTKDGYRTAYIDCFQRDHVDDPFVMVAAELVALAKADRSALRGLVAKGAQVAAGLLPAVAKLSIKAAGHLIVGDADAGDALAKAALSGDEAAANALEAAFKKRIEAHEVEKRSIEGFKKELGALAAKDVKPIVIFVDELDRCRPDFAVATIESIKHFFEVPGIVFIVMLNGRQLASAVKGVYGSDVDAEAYLGKFIQLPFSLPKRRARKQHERDDNLILCDSLLSKFGFDVSSEDRRFSRTMGPLGGLLRLSLRDMERAVALYSFAYPLHEDTALAAWPIAIKLSNSELFGRLAAGDQDAHSEALALFLRLSSLSQDAMHDLAPFHDLHACGAGGYKNQLPDGPAKELFEHRGRLDPKGFMEWIFARVDLSFA